MTFDRRRPHSVTFGPEPEEVGHPKFPGVEKCRCFRCIGNMRNLLDLKKTRSARWSPLIFQNVRKAVLGNSGSARAEGGIEKFWKYAVDRSALDS